MTKICVIGNFSGRNAGDAAILGGLLHDISSRYPDCQYLIPTIKPGFITQAYKNHNVIPVGLLPWNLSIKILGLPILRSILASDLVLITDAILFDYKLMNPLYNYLFTLSFVLPLAKSRKIPVVLYNVSLGPVYSDMGKTCLRRVLESSDLILLRDAESVKLLENLGLNYFSDIMFNAADCALNTIPSNKQRLNEICNKEDILRGDMSWVSFNISSYIDVYVRGYKGRGIGKEKFLNLIAEVIDMMIENLSVSVVLVITQPMDLQIANQLLAKLKNQRFIKLISNREYTYQDIASVFSSVEIHVGMRTHSLILASSVLTPVVGIIATPKNRGYMCSIEQDDRMVEFKNMTVDSLYTVIRSTWDDRRTIRAELGPIIGREKKKASSSADYLKQYMN